MEALLAVPIKDDEIFGLLERLAATEEMFKTPISTIRDVAELTEASPNLIARILGEIRGPGEYEKLQAGLQDHEGRIKELERSATPPTTASKPSQSGNQLSEEFKESAQEKYIEMLKKERISSPLERFMDASPILQILFVVLVLLVCFYLADWAVSPGRVPPPYESR